MPILLFGILVRGAKGGAVFEIRCLSNGSGKKGSEKMKFKAISMAAFAAAITVGGALATSAGAVAQEKKEYPPGPIITLQLANMEELCTGANFEQYGSTRNFVRALTLNIRLTPGDDKREVIVTCAENLEAAAQQGHIPDQLLDLAIGWVQQSCVSLIDLGFVERKTCAEVRNIRDRNML